MAAHPLNSRAAKGVAHWGTTYIWCFEAWLASYFSRRLDWPIWVQSGFGPVQERAKYTLVSLPTRQDTAKDENSVDEQRWARGGGSVWVAAKAASHEDGAWTVDAVSGLRDELADRREKPGGLVTSKSSGKCCIQKEESRAARSKRGAGDVGVDVTQAAELNSTAAKREEAVKERETTGPDASWGVENSDQTVWRVEAAAAKRLHTSDALTGPLSATTCKARPRGDLCIRPPPYLQQVAFCGTPEYQDPAISGVQSYEPVRSPRHYRCGWLNAAAGKNSLGPGLPRAQGRGFCVSLKKLHSDEE
ncbi:hypothetical protein B0T18DRAFT_389128 [Schizothecium vesticola]|uniref:Uncharacterized protein n=1 Tax=Schizothecium vesticola TaxID=314040 RepID=A0AA40K865_9PEZI|nr:hypothetical protein B0T18DRAFT_389128 [Schizothecium vesticola]